MSNRRKLRRALRLVDAVNSGRLPLADVQIWEQETCQGCGLTVQFAAGQTVNRCAWCGNTVAHGMG